MPEFMKLVLNKNMSSVNLRLSTIFNPMIYYLAFFILMMFVLICSYIFGDKTLFFTLLCLFIFASIIYFIFYMYLASKKPDYLRSENYNIQKIIAESGILGDMNNLPTEDYLNETPKSIQEPIKISEGGN